MRSGAKQLASEPPRASPLALLAWTEPPPPSREKSYQSATQVGSTVGGVGPCEELRWARAGDQTEGGEPHPIRAMHLLQNAIPSAVPASLPRRERWLCTCHEDERSGGGGPLKRVVAAPHRVGQREIVMRKTCLSGRGSPPPDRSSAAREKDPPSTAQRIDHRSNRRAQRKTNMTFAVLHASHTIGA